MGTPAGASTDRVICTTIPDFNLGKPYFSSKHVWSDSDQAYNLFWFLTDDLHSWFVENEIPYALYYELLDWYVEVPDRHAVMVKLALGQ